MINNDEYAAYVADIINTKSLALFGALLRLVCSRAGISQNKLAKDSKDLIKYFKEQGWMRSWETVDVNQSSVSDAVRGQLEPSFHQLRIWLYAIEKIYADPVFIEKCRKRGKLLSFPHDLKMDIWYLALKGMEGDIVAAYNRRRDLVLELRLEYRNGIEPTSKSNPMPQPSHEPKSDAIHNAVSEARKTLEKQY